jgi:hypothetical protein
MKKLLALVLLASTVLLACGAKKAPTTPQEAPLEKDADATGGATYGGNDAAGKDAPADPDAPK